MKLLIIFLLLLTVVAYTANAVITLSPGDVFIYELSVSHQDELFTYNYTFIINSVNRGTINFTMIVINLNNDTSASETYVFPTTDLKYLPYNGSLFNTENLTFYGYELFKGQNSSVYTGYFLFNGVKIPIKAYYVNGTLDYLNGSYNGYYVQLTLVAHYNQNEQTQVSTTLTNYIVLAIVIIFIVVGVVLLVKIGKI
ncbi:hypothetical protein [Stygiolobus caldivivus]|uniref:Uncharacterized protein n=1 Tax=Stygiolobus caldivivus TaxID=2824673 RepID=A0A8D5U4V3_9CREN|nr:hypothetical protein [Stygiolobus caldivivus]BCU69297.1 hypothetical protein KN1_05940 [Stygiolobus caldivivus]